MDIVTQVGSIKYALDVTIVSPLLAAATKSAATRAAEAKKLKYMAACKDQGYRFVPAAFDMWGGRCSELDGFIASALKTASILHPYVTHPRLAVHTRITVGLWKAVGGLLTATLSAQRAF